MYMNTFQFPVFNLNYIAIIGKKEDVLFYQIII